MIYNIYITYIVYMVFCSCFRITNNHPVQDNITFVNWQSALINCQQDDVLLQELFGYMISGLTAHRIEILKEYENGNHEKVSGIAHRIKGDSATLACGNLTSHAAILQKDPRVKQNIDNLIRSIDKTMEVINKRYG